MIPLIHSMAPAMGGEEAIKPVWWALALGAYLGGYGTLVGASANLTVAGIAEKNGAAIYFLPFTLRAFPQMLLSIITCHFYVLWRFFYGEHRMRLLTVLLAVELCGCATPHMMERSPGYEMGYSDGCASAAAQGPGVPREPKRNEMLFTSDPDYRAGWNSGNVQCRVQGPNRL